MQMFTFLAKLSISACYIILLPLVECSSHEDLTVSTNHKSIKHSLNKVQMSPEMRSHVKIHGILLWASMGFLMPVGILTIRMSIRETGTKAKVFFYLHLFFQILSVLLSSIGAVLSIKNFENSFNNNHQRLGLALYAVMWVQAVVGFLRPPRGKKRRSTWYFVHWLLGTSVTLVGIINIYTGLRAYHHKTSRSTTIWTIIFTAEISFMAFLYLFQDKWEYMQKQGVILGNNNNVEPPVTTTTSVVQVMITERDNEKVLVPEPCGKRNALKNLFD
ncbi:hypothetical protein Ddye_024570 [Dipteronia dyeriana]|uniref:Cytochrome b561 domain-containing protein n=1 Tax=Dipteronia dyeriana TaxID=168575 RepID=A0AAD9TVK2_9ROSI|nr:hypothetical protein Ddye_024570 [Dipteronia dyeriana]